MPDHDIHEAIFESLLEQTKAVRDIKIQVESLKQMMFEHRPAFVPTFEELVKQLTASSNVQQLDLLIERLQNALHLLKAG